jgi:N-acetylmuramoyl-L-alanine amidase
VAANRVNNPMPNHTVQQGECLVRIAAQYGFRDYHTVYDDPGNADLRKKRPNPNTLFPGDIVFIPEKVEKKQPAATTKVHKFRVAGSQRILRIVVEDLDGKKLAAKAYEIEIEGKVTAGVTGADGLIEQPIPLDAENGSLTVGRYTWTLAIAHLNPLDDTSDDGVSGMQARLRNMGYDPGPIDGILGPLTEAAIAEFQADNPPLKVDGVCGPQTRARLVDTYGC